MPTPRVGALGAAFLALIFQLPPALSMPDEHGAVRSYTGPQSDRPIKIVATLPILKEFAEHVGGNRVQVVSLLTGFESEHSYSPKPSDLKAIGQARLLLEIGLGLEIWASSLIKDAGNPQLRVVTTSAGIAVIEDGASGQHSRGNPHIWLDPQNAKVMTRHIADGLIEVDPAHTRDYQDNLNAYLRRLDELEKALLLRVSALRDRRIITYHPAWPYFARRFGFTIEGDIILQVGAEPSAAHLARLANHIKTEKIKVIVSEPQLNQKVAQVLGSETGARVVVLSPLPGTLKGTETYLAMLAYDIDTLVTALQS